MKLVLQINERTVRLNVKSNVSEHASNNVGSDGSCLCFNYDFVKDPFVVFDCVSRRLAEAKVRPKTICDALKAKQIIAICGNFNLVDNLFRDINGLPTRVVSLHLHLDSITDFKFNSILEANIEEFIICEFLANCSE